MCLACEEQELLYRYELELAVARDVIPVGLTAADFVAAGLPVPGRVAADNAPSEAVNAFVCDSPDTE